MDGLTECRQLVAEEAVQHFIGFDGQEFTLLNREGFIFWACGLTVAGRAECDHRRKGENVNRERAHGSPLLRLRRMMGDVVLAFGEVDAPTHDFVKSLEEIPQNPRQFS